MRGCQSSLCGVETESAQRHEHWGRREDSGQRKQDQQPVGEGMDE